MHWCGWGQSLDERKGTTDAACAAFSMTRGGPAPESRRWESGLGTDPPPAVAAVLMPGEKPLWAATVSSTGSANILFGIGAIGMISVALVAYLAPWGQSLGTLCPPGETPSCRKVYVAVFLWVFLAGPGFLSFIWMGWRARYRPWLWHCAVTTTRALLVDGRGPRVAGAVDLSRHPPLADTNGRLAFGKKPIRLAMWGALPPEERRRALRWARTAQQSTAMDDPK
jgi:hypothetical protein